MIYIDHAATTRASPKVIVAMNEALQQGWGNPSALYAHGRKAKEAVEEAREKVAIAIGAKPSEIYFASGGSEANNWAIRALPRKRIVTSSIEHHAVLNVCREMEGRCEVVILKPKPDGIIEVERVREALKHPTDLVSIMTVNNELGTIQPIAEIAALCKGVNVSFHTDAVQAIGNIPVNVQELGCDMLSLSGHKFHAPKGVGALYIKSGVELPPFIHGGQQENGLRAGTENVPGIVGMGVAIEEAVAGCSEKHKHLERLSNLFLAKLMRIPECRFNGNFQRRIPGTVNVSFKGIDASTLVLWLDRHGICASAGSACDSQNYSASHVIRSIGVAPEYAAGSVRFSFGRDNTLLEADVVANRVAKCVSLLRSNPDPTAIYI